MIGKLIAPIAPAPMPIAHPVAPPEAVPRTGAPNRVVSPAVAPPMAERTPMVIPDTNPLASSRGAMAL